MNTILKIGHRGAKGYAPENTLASFEKAIELNVDVIELDVHISADGEIMVIHDESIQRTTSGKGLVKELTSLQLKELGIPTLREVLNLVFKQTIINIELKSKESVHKVVYLIDALIFLKGWNYNLFQISSFDWELLEIVSKMNRPILIGVLTKNKIEKAIIFAKKIKAHSINPHFKSLNQEKVNLIHDNGLKIYTWTVNTIEDIQKMKTFNVNGIISDFPDRI